MWPDIPIPYIKEKYKPALIIFLGLLTSIWASCAFLISLCQYTWDYGVINNVMAAGILSFVTISVTVSFGLNWSFKQHDPVYMLPWVYTKIVEIVLMLHSIVLLGFGSYWYQWFIFMPAIFMVIGSYITHRVWKIYKKLEQLRQAATNNTTNSLETPTESPEKNEEGCWPTVDAPYMPCDNKLKTPSIIVLGLLVSFWANCLFNSELSQFVYLRKLENAIVGFAIGTYYLIGLGTTCSLIYGLQHTDPDFVKLWLYNKVLDEVLLLAGIIMLIADGRYPFNWLLLLVGLFNIGIGGYVLRSIFKTYKTMETVQIQPTNNTTDASNNNETMDNPPTYDEFVNQRQMTPQVNHI